jgi:hypothetical protein
MLETKMKAKGHDHNQSEQELRSLVDGSLVVGDWVHAMIARGFGYHVSIGGFSTPITGGGNGTILDLDQPEGVVSVPSGWTIMPVRVHIQLQTPLLATDADESEALIVVDRGNAWAGDGTFTRETPYNLRTDRGPARDGISAGCPVECASAFTADMTVDGTTDTTHHIELARSVLVGDVQTAAGVFVTKHELLYEPKYAPFLVGPCAMYLYWGGTVATPGFAQIDFVAIPSAKLTNLV